MSEAIVEYDADGHAQWKQDFVRCKDCMYNDVRTNHCYFNVFESTYPEGFCSFAIHELDWGSNDTDASIF